MKKSFLLLILGLIPTLAIAQQVNFNQAWFHNNYGHQFMSKSFDSYEVNRIFELSHNAGAKSVRLWFFEDARFSMINFKGDKPLSLKPEFIENVIETLQLAKRNDQKIYMTIFDAHQMNPFQYELKNILRMRRLVGGKYAKAFLQNIIRPLMERIKSQGLLSVIERLDVMNEGDTFVNRFGFPLKWVSVKKMLCTWKKEIISRFRIPLTMSVRLHPLTPLPFNFFWKRGPMECADFFDVHSYQDAGKIMSCSKLKKVAKWKEVVLGEFGQAYFNSKYDNELQVKNTKGYIQQAKKCGISSLYAWRLSDIRPGHNKEARYSFEAFGKPRPAYYTIQQHNQNQ